MKLRPTTGIPAGKQAFDLAATVGEGDADIVGQRLGNRFSWSASTVVATIVSPGLRCSRMRSAYCCVVSRKLPIMRTRSGRVDGSPARRARIHQRGDDRWARDRAPRASLNNAIDAALQLAHGGRAQAVAAMAVAHIGAGAGLRFDEAGMAQLAIDGRHRHRRDAGAVGEFAHRRQALARTAIRRARSRIRSGREAGCRAERGACGRATRPNRPESSLHSSVLVNCHSQRLQQ